MPTRTKYGTLGRTRGERGSDYGQPRRRMRSRNFEPGDRIRYKSDGSLGTVERAGNTYLTVRFDDGERGEVHISQVIHSPAAYGPKGRLPNEKRDYSGYGTEELQGYLKDFRRQLHTSAVLTTTEQQRLRKMIREIFAELERRQPKPKRVARNPGLGKAFTFHGSASSKLAAERIKAKVPGSFLEYKDGRYYILKPRKIATASFYEPRNMKRNAAVPRGAVRIYGRCLRIEAIKNAPHTYGGKATGAGQKYWHDFTTKNAIIYGLPDGSLLIKAK